MRGSAPGGEALLLDHFNEAGTGILVSGVAAATPRARSLLGPRAPFGVRACEPNTVAGLA
jgi:hypothetical protein